MDKSLREYLKQADLVHEFMEKFAIALSPKQLEEKITELQVSIKSLQAVSKRIADITNIAMRLYKHKTIKRVTALSNKSIILDKSNTTVDKSITLDKSNTTKPNKFLDPYPTMEDHGTLRTLYPEEKKAVVGDLFIPIRTVSNTSEIPVSNLYYVDSLKQYAINVNGIIIKGELGNIVDYKTKNSNRCEYGTECKSFNKDKGCSYYHPPEDYIKNKKPVQTTDRNFTAGSWIYSKTKTPKTYFCRHMGSKDRVMYDLNTLKKVQYREEIFNREGQLVHDLLIYLILNSKGLLERYPHWIAK